MSSMRYKLLLFVLFAGFLAVRIVHIEADPPKGLSFSAGIWVDEMHNIHQVRNKILFGSWSLDRWPSNAYSPPWALFQYLILSAIGVGYWQMKMLPIGLSLVTLILAYLAMSESFGRRCGMVTVLPLGFDYTFIMYNRLGLFENLVITFMTATLFFWQRAVRSERQGYFFLTGLSAGCVFIAKSLYFPLVIAAGLAFLGYLLKKGIRASLPSARMGLLGGLAAAVLWFFTCYLPFHESLSLVGGSWVRQNMKPLTAGAIFSNNPIFPFVTTFRFLPVSVGLCLLLTAGMGYRWFRKEYPIDPVELFLFFWLACGILFLGHLSYAPTRYYLPVLPAVVLMAGRFIVGIGEDPKHPFRLKPDIPMAVTTAIGLFLFFFYILFPYLEKEHPDLRTLLFFHHPSRLGDLWASFLLGIFAAGSFLSMDFLKNRGRLYGFIPVLPLFLISFYVLTASTEPFCARVELEMISDGKDKARIYWAGDPAGYREQDSKGVHVQKGHGRYEARIGSLRKARFLRIDPLTRKGEVTLRKLRVVQPGFPELIFDTPEAFQAFSATHHIGRLTASPEGLRVETAGSDPNLEVPLPVEFRPSLIVRPMIWILFASAGIALGGLLFFRLASPLWEAYVSHPKFARKWAWALAVCGAVFSFVPYLRWAATPVYAIATASREIGEMLPEDALIAGQGVMAVTIKNRIRHVQAPNWFEENDKIFDTYPITHLFVSPYAGYLGWYRRTFPEIMAAATVIGRYRIHNIDFELYRLPPIDRSKS